MTKRESPAPESAEYWLGEILAVIHGDGGHYRAQHGNQKATEDAIAKWHARSVPEPGGDLSTMEAGDIPPARTYRMEVTAQDQHGNTQKFPWTLEITPPPNCVLCGDTGRLKHTVMMGGNLFVPGSGCTFCGALNRGEKP